MAGEGWLAAEPWPILFVSQVYSKWPFGYERHRELYMERPTKTDLRNAGTAKGDLF